MSDPIEQLAINTIRTLSMDAVQKANSGHPGTPMGAAPIAYTVWQKFLTYDPTDPIWANRDRFVLSVGHASMLLYSIIHLTGIKKVVGDKITADAALTLDDLKKFRQIDSLTPGHPEYHHTSGVEVTTGPLGQGVANSVGMAIASKYLGATYNKPGYDLFDYRVYALAGDGCMMEGVSSEAASLAGHLKLGNLCWIYDSNKISIEGSTDLAFHEDTAARFRAYGWQVIVVEDGNDTPAIAAALELFRNTHDKPTFIVVKTIIGYGAGHKAGTREAHGEPLGVEEIKHAKKSYGLDENASFVVPAEVLSHFAHGVGARGKTARDAWFAKFGEYKTAFPEAGAHIEAMLKGDLPPGWDKDLPTYPADAKGVASRDSSGKVLNAIAKNVPWLVGGSADLHPSTKTYLTFEGAGAFQYGSYGGHNFHFGVREHAMTSVINGMTVSKLRAYGSGFMIFSDYARPAIRLSALMELPVIHIFTHDSIGVGEDGPTHQPIEQLCSLRAIPNLITMRPGDANEVVEAWKVVMTQKHHPVALILSRQVMPTLDRTKYAPASGVAKGAYVVADAKDGKPAVIIMGTGTELGLCVEAYEALTAEGIAARVVSMPSWELYEKQPKEYRDSVLPPNIIARVAVEQASSFGWAKYLGLTGAAIAMTTFGASAPLSDLKKKFGFAPDKVVEAAKAQIASVKAHLDAVKAEMAGK